MAKKKVRKLPPLSETLVDPDTKDPEATMMEINELWSFVDKKEIRYGYGLLSVERHAKLLLEL